MKKGLLTLLTASLVFVGCQNYDDQFDDLNAQISALKTQVDGLSSLSGQVASLSGTISGLQAGVTAAQSAASSASAAASAIDLSSLSASLATLQDEVDAVQASIASTATASAVTTGGSVGNFFVPTAQPTSLGITSQGTTAVNFKKGQTVMVQAQTSATSAIGGTGAMIKGVVTNVSGQYFQIKAYGGAPASKSNTFPFSLLTSINEPNVFSLLLFMRATRPPRSTSPLSSVFTYAVLIPNSCSNASMACKTA